MTSEHACLEFPVDRASVPFHPLEDYGQKALAMIGGPDLDDVAALSSPLPSLGAYIPQIRMRRRRGILPHRAAYGIRLDQVLRRRVWSAVEVRAFCGIPDRARLVLLCFADDAILEDLWDDATRFRAVAEGRWDLITAPSYSLWYRRPRPFHFHSIKRSYDAFAAFQQLGAVAIPRADFIDMRDIERQSDWFNANSGVGLVSLDWMTCRAERDWIVCAELLAVFDRLTGARLRYLINGTTAFPRIKYLVELLGAARLTFSDATAVPPPETCEVDDLPTDLLTDSQWRRRVAAREHLIAAAIAAARPALAPQTGCGTGSERIRRPQRFGPLVDGAPLVGCFNAGLRDA